MQNIMQSDLLAGGLIPLFSAYCLRSVATTPCPEMNTLLTLLRRASAHLTLWRALQEAYQDGEAVPPVVQTVNLPRGFAYVEYKTREDAGEGAPAHGRRAARRQCAQVLDLPAQLLLLTARIAGCR